mmetsp:Transcript_111814/g.323157  ORF Transcript_111814/g.323157 Transcript_111814/m.323157 type:complete len:434 (-) Transcript_111814:578-1879(-)
MRGLLPHQLELQDRVRHALHGELEAMHELGVVGADLAAGEEAPGGLRLATHQEAGPQHLGVYVENLGHLILAQVILLQDGQPPFHAFRAHDVAVLRLRGGLRGLLRDPGRLGPCLGKAGQGVVTDDFDPILRPLAGTCKLRGGIYTDKEQPRLLEVISHGVDGQGLPCRTHRNTPRLARLPVLVLELQHHPAVLAPTNAALRRDAQATEEVVVADKVLVEELQLHTLVTELRHRNDHLPAELGVQGLALRWGLEPVCAALDHHVGVRARPMEPRRVLGKQPLRTPDRERQNAMRRRASDAENVRFGPELEADAVREHHGVADAVGDYVQDLLADEAKVQQALAGALEVDVDKGPVVEEEPDPLKERRLVHQPDHLEQQHALHAKPTDAQADARVLQVNGAVRVPVDARAEDKVVDVAEGGLLLVPNDVDPPEL